MSDGLLIGLIVAGVAIFGGWMAWVSNKTMNNSERINDLILLDAKKNTDVDDLKGEFEKVEKRMNESLDRFDKRLLSFVSTELEELKSIILHAKEARERERDEKREEKRR